MVLCVGQVQSDQFQPKPFLTCDILQHPTAWNRTKATTTTGPQLLERKVVFVPSLSASRFMGELFTATSPLRFEALTRSNVKFRVAVIKP